MKAFILVALAASVAARSLDIETLRQLNQKTGLPTGQTMDDVLLKEQQLKKNLLVGQGTVLDTTPIVGDKLDVDRVFTITELYNIPLFRSYLDLPLFREYIQYPSFQRYVASTYFQKFWTVPAFKQYFVNPVLFYKYIYPVVQVFKTEYTIPTVYGQQEDVLGLQTVVDEVTTMKNKNFIPFVNNRFAVPTTTFPGTETNYKFIMDKLAKTLFINKPVVGDIAEVKTDVKIVPQKVVLEPFTNQVTVEQPKIVDVQVEQQVVPVVDTFAPITERTVAILKDLVRKNIITPEVYEAITLGKLEFTDVLRQVLLQRGITTDLVSLIINRLVKVDTIVPVVTEQDKLLIKELLVQKLITPEVYQALIVGKVDLFTILRQLIVRRDVIDTIAPVVETTTILTERNIALLKDLVQRNIISADVYRTVLLGQIDFNTILRQVLLQRGISNELITLIVNRLVNYDTVVPTTTQQDVYIVRALYLQNLISSEMYQAVLVGKVDIFTVLRQIVLRGVLVDTVTPYTNIFTDRVNYNNLFGINRNVYNTEIPTIRNNVYNRFPIMA